MEPLSASGRSSEKMSLLTLQSKMKTDPESYETELHLIRTQFYSALDLFHQQAALNCADPTVSKDLSDRAMFLAHVTPFYPDQLAEFPTDLAAFLRSSARTLPSGLRFHVTQALIFLVNRQIVDIRDILSLFMELQTLGDRNLRPLCKALILHSIRDSWANHSVKDGILDSLILIEKFDRQRNIPTSDAMRDAFRAVAVHCTLKWLLPSWSSYFDAVQRIWALRIKNLEDSDSSDLFSPDLARWKTEIEAALWDTETSQRLLDIDTIGEALNCTELYLNEAFLSIKPAFHRLAVSPTEEKVDNVASASEQLPSSPHPCNNEENVDNVASASAQLHSSPHPCNNEENVDNVASASAQLPSSPRPCNNAENVDNVASASEQLPSSPHPCNNEENAADWSSLPTPEIEKVRDSLKSSVADLLAAVTDPLPKVLEVADRISSYVTAAKKLQTQGVEGDGNKDVGVLEEAISKDHDRMDRSVPSPSVDHMVEPSQAKEGNEAFIRPNKMRRTSLMEKNDTAHTFDFEWEYPIDGSAEGTSGCSNRSGDPIDGLADKTTSSSDRCTLPSPKTNHVSPLKKSKPLKWARMRKINRWTNEEERALIEGVKKYGTQWKLILEIYEQVLGNRTQVDLKDKWRNLTR